MRAIIYSLIDRAILLSDPIYHNDNINKVKTLLFKNNYPLSFINKNIQNRLKNMKFVIKDKKLRKYTYAHFYLQKDKVHIPFMGNDFFKFKNIFRKYNIQTIPINNNKLNHIVRLGKDRVNKMDQTNAVYKFSCSQCFSSYVGESKRALKIRVNEHANCYNKKSVVSQHIGMGHNFDWDNIKILDIEPIHKKRLISEMLHITCNDNTINKKKDTYSLSRLYKTFLQ